MSDELRVDSGALIFATLADVYISSGMIDECLWDLGDGRTIANCGSLSANYRSEGLFTISLTVRGPGGEDTMSVEHCVKVAYHRSYMSVMIAKE